MTLIISLIVLMLGLVSLMVVIWRRVADIRSESLFVNAAAADEMLALWQRRVDGYYYGFGLFFRTIAHQIYFYFLVIIKSVAATFRFLLVAVERKCAKLIDSAHNRGVVK